MKELSLELSVPALVLAPDGDELGTILLLHGFTGSKEANRRELESLAAHGWRAVGIDAVGHGTRVYQDFEQRFAMFNPRRREREFLQVVETTAQEIRVLLDELETRLGGPFGLVGISMGGDIGYRAVLLDRRIRALCTIGASPLWRLPLPESPVLHPEGFFPVALLSQNGGLDDVVSPRPAAELAVALRTYYQAGPERLRHIELADGTHLLENHWDAAWASVLRWLERFVKDD